MPRQGEDLVKKENIPNWLSFFRLLCVGGVVAAFACDRMVAALVIYLVASFTDILDGYLARRNHWITDLGKLLDPLADKLLQLSVLICFKGAGLIGWWPLAVVLVKELAMIAGGFFLYKNKDRVVYANWMGKLSTFVFFGAIILTFLHDYTAPWDGYIMTGAVALAVVTMLQYAYLNVYKPYLRRDGK